MSPPSGLDAFLAAIAQQESGGNYGDVNSGSGALGKYQVMPDNVADWTRRALGRSETPDQFLHDPSAQEAVARTILGGYYSQYGAAGAAAMWYSGQPDPTKTYGSPSVAEYVKEVLARLTGGGTSTTPQGPGVQPALGLGDVTGWNAVSGAISGFAGDIKNLVIATPFLAAGIALVVVGVVRASGNVGKSLGQKAKQAASVAAMAA